MAKPATCFRLERLHNLQDLAQIPGEDLRQLVPELLLRLPSEALVRGLSKTITPDILFIMFVFS